MRKIDFNDNWSFHRDDDMARTVDLPHDAMILEKRDLKSPGGSGTAFFSAGAYVYEKTFSVPAEWADRYVTFQFEGVYKNSKVYINGKKAGGQPYGYIPFFVKADNFLNYGAENAVRVEVDNKDMPNSRWYSGAGIYRPVWLYVSEKTHIAHEGVKISTLSYNPARIRVEVEHAGGDVFVEIQRSEKIVASGGGNTVELDIPEAELWSDETPNLYNCHVTLCENGFMVDEVTESFGIRLVEWSAKGLSINGKETLLRGGCIHHDNGILGARSYAESEARRVRIMKEAGYNAIRSAHNPASKAMLQACDRLGMYVMDETWDMWYSHKSKYDYACDFNANYEYDIQAMVNRDFNHPSVIMYSIGNEVSEPYQEKGVALTRKMVEWVHSLDENRAVTAGINLFIIHRASKGQGVYKEEGGRDEKTEKKSSASGSLFFNMVASKMGSAMNRMANSRAVDKITAPCLDLLDIAGYNYASGRYPLEGSAHPNRVIVGSETFPQDIGKNWAMVKQYPYLVGDFMWAGWDYLGETGAGAWAYTNDAKSFSKPYPWLLADAGAIDILGHVGAEAAYAAVVWGLRKQPVIVSRPVNHANDRLTKAVWRGTNAIGSWAWKNCEGNRAMVEVYADADRVELFLNGRSLGKKRIKAYRAIFKTRYVPGNLEAIAYDASGSKLGRSTLFSATGETRIAIRPEKSIIKAGDIVYVNVELVGENGVVESNADAKLTVTVDGAELLAFGSANPRTEENYNSGSFSTYYGRALAVIRSRIPGDVSVHVSGAELGNASETIVVL